MNGDAYAVLGILVDADAAAIHAAYRRAVRRAHPDVGGTAAQFEAVQEAYETLRDPAQRRAYDAARAPRRPPPPPPPLDDVLAESRRLENEARELAGLPPRDFGGPKDGTDADDSFMAILDDAQRQLRDAAGITARELRRRVRRML